MILHSTIPTPAAIAATESLNSRILVVGEGGWGTSAPADLPGRPGGQGGDRFGASGGSFSADWLGGVGGDQLQGGASPSVASKYPGSPGAFGYGGAGFVSGEEPGGRGGNGWYGGGGGAKLSGGGGGSTYTMPNTFIISNQQGGYTGSLSRLYITVTKCNAEYYLNASACVSCPTGYSTATADITGTNASVCDVCAAGYTGTSVGGTSGCTACESNSYSNAGNEMNCIPCVANKTGCGTGAGFCKAGYGTDNQGATCVECIAGKYKHTVDNTPCRSCASAGNTGCGLMSAGTCDAGYGTSDNGSTCTLCAAGTSFKTAAGNTACAACATNNTGCGGSFAGSCNAGYGTLDAVVHCEQCIAGKYNSGTPVNIACAACPSGKYQPLAASASCNACATNNSGCGSTSVGTCNVGYGSTDNGITCKACNPSFYKDTAGNSACTACISSKYSLEAGSATCKTCDAHASGCGGNSAGTCLAGFGTSDGGQSCVGCIAGKYATAGNLPCAACAVGHVSPSGASVCTACVAGKMAVAAENLCKTCTAGTYALAESNTCRSCETGKINPATGADSCTACGAGTENNLDFTKCISCPIGKYSKADAETCVNCAKGFFSDVTGSTSCTACAAGLSSNPGASVCVDPKSLVTESNNGNNSTSSEGLTAGISIGVVCILCIAGYYYYLQLEEKKRREQELAKHIKANLNRNRENGIGEDPIAASRKDSDLERGNFAGIDGSNQSNPINSKSVQAPRKAPPAPSGAKPKGMTQSEYLESQIKAKMEMIAMQRRDEVQHRML